MLKSYQLQARYQDMESEIMIIGKRVFKKLRPLNTVLTEHQMCMCVYLCVWVCNVHTHTHAHTHTHIYIYICIYIYIYY